MKKKPRHFSILIVPEGEGKTLQFKVHSLAFKILVLTCLIFAVGAIASILFTGRIAAKVQLANYLAKKNEDLKDENKKIEILARELDEIQKRENRIRILATSFLKDRKKQLEMENLSASSKKDIDEFVSKVRRKQKSLGLATAEGGGSYHSRMLAAVPTLRPVDGWITRGFSLKIEQGSNLTGHRGIDIAVASGTPIMAAAPGLITYSKWHKSFGNTIVINHGFGYETVYGHCSQLLSKRGDLVERGQTVALVGSSGRSTAPHLHYEIKKNGYPVDPLLFFIH